MRRGTWILALSGAMALNGSAVIADDPLADGPGANPPKAARTYTRAAGASQKAAPKSNFSELFNDQPPAVDRPASATAGSSLGDWMDEAPAAKPAAKPATAKATAEKTAVTEKPASEKSVTEKAVAERPAADKSAWPEPAKPAAADARKFSPAARTAKPAADGSESRVIQAAYDKMPPAAERKMIQQVRSEATGKTAAAMPEFGGASDTPASKSAPSAAAGAGRIVVDSGPQTPQVTIEWLKRGDMNVGQECQLELHVKNAGAAPATQVAVDTMFPNTVRLTGADPKPVVSADRATWNFESIPAGGSQKISIKLIPSRRGDLGAVANVRFTGSASMNYRVEEPMLKIALKGPTEVMLGDPASQQILVSNPGTGTAQDVKVEARLSDGLEGSRPGERLMMDVGSIGPGETRMVRLGLSAIKGGQQTISITANSSSEAVATATAQLSVIAPSLKIAAEGPALRYKGRNAKYSITVTNDGSVANNNIRINHGVPEGFKFVSADRSGKYDVSTKNVQWFIGRLEPGQTAQVSCELNASTLGDYVATSTVLSDSGVRADAKVSTKIDGVASLTMELVDLDDPVEIGAETAYEIRVRNEGSKFGAGVSIACELPPEMELKTVKAPVDAIVSPDGRQILFKPLEQVAPGAQVVYRVFVKGVQEGTHRMRVRMTGASLMEPVVREEATKVYADSK